MDRVHATRFGVDSALDIAAPADPGALTQMKSRSSVSPARLPAHRGRLLAGLGATLALGAAGAFLAAEPGRAASHREAPVTALDRLADITDFFAFVSPDDPSTLTTAICTDPLLEPSNGPNYFP